MYKKIVGRVLQLMALMGFIAFALACASQQNLTTDPSQDGGEGSGTNDGAAIDIQVDTIIGSNYYAFK